MLLQTQTNELWPKSLLTQFLFSPKIIFKKIIKMQIMSLMINKTHENRFDPTPDILVIMTSYQLFIL